MCVRLPVKRFLFSKLHFLVGDDKHVIRQVFARLGKMSGVVWYYHCYLGSTKRALIFFQFEQKPAQSHINIAKSSLPLFAEI